MSKATKKTNRKKKDKQNEHIKKPTETEIIDVTIPYITIPSPNTTDITEEDTVLQTDDTQEESHDDANSDSEAMPLITTEKKNSWVWSFYDQVQTSDGDIFTICKVEGADGIKCNKRYKTKGSTGNLINHLLKHGVTKDNPYPIMVCKIIIIINSLIFLSN